MRSTTYWLIIGKLQSGKTVFAIEEFSKYLQEEECLPIFCTHNANNIFDDLYSKLSQDYTYYDPREPTKSFGHNSEKTTFKKFIKTIMEYGTVDKGHGIIGLSNRYFHEKIAPAILNYHHKKVMFVDEYDTSQIGFTSKRQAVQRDNWLHSYDIEKVVDEMVLLSATNLSAAISNKTFDPGSIKIIKPGKGYKGWGKKHINRDRFNRRAFEQLRKGNPRGDIFDLAESAKGHVMINIDTHIDVHERIANVFREAGFKTMVVNSDVPFNFEELKKPEKVILIGGSMFDRGQTFHGLSTLIIDREKIHQAALLQAVGRLFGYKNYELTLVATHEMFERIDDCFNLENQIAKEKVLYMPREERWHWIEKNVEFKSEKVLSSKPNGAREGIRKLGKAQIPHMRQSAEPENDNHVTKIQTKVYTIEGTPKRMLFGEHKHVGTCKWGNRSPDKMADDFVDQHPQGLTMGERNERGNIRRKIIVPPTLESYDGEESGYYEEWIFGNPAECDWYIDNSMSVEERDQINTKFVASVSASGEWLIWYNINLLDEDDDLTKETRHLIFPRAA